MTGTQISDMTISATAPEGSFFPFIVTDAATGLDPGSNYRYDLGTDLLTRVSYEALAAADGSELVGYAGPQVGAETTTVKAAIDATGFMGALATTARLQAAINYIGLNGGTLIIPPGTYTLTSQVTLAPTALKNIHIIGYGAEITTTGAISGLRISEAIYVPQGIVVEGLKVNHRANGDATAGFELVHSALVTFRNCTVEAHGTNASYAGFLLRQSDVNDENTGCFWNTLENCSVRKRGGGDVGNIRYGIKLQGYNNVTRIIGGTLGYTTTGIYIIPEAGSIYISNAVLIDGMAFEGQVETAIRIVGDASNAISGLRVENCRAEAVDVFISFAGSTAQPVTPPFLAGNYLTPDVLYINNPQGLYINSLDSSENAVNGPEFFCGAPFAIHNVAGTGHTMDLYASLAGATILQLFDSASPGNLLVRFDWITGALARLLANANSLKLCGIRSISNTTTDAENLRGTATFAAATTVAVVFGTAEPDSSYFVQLTPNADPVGRLWTSAKATGGFTINNSSSTSISVDWLLIR